MRYNGTKNDIKKIVINFLSLRFSNNDLFILDELEMVETTFLN